MKFQKLGAKVYGTLQKMGTKANQDKLMKFGQKAMHTAKQVDSTYSGLCNFVLKCCNGRVTNNQSETGCM